MNDLAEKELKKTAEKELKKAGRLKGCNYWADCLTCPFYDCVQGKKKIAYDLKLVIDSFNLKIMVLKGLIADDADR